MEQLGIDIGGSGIKAAIVNSETGEFITDRYKVNTPQPATPDDVAEEIAKLIKHFNWKEKVGCCFPTIVREGECFSSGNISPKWKGIQIDEFFKEATNGVEFVIGNDADLAGIAEVHLGAAKDKRGKVMMITIGTGLGTGLFYNGTLIPNIEFGQMAHTNGEKIEFYAANSARKKENLELDVWAKRFNVFLEEVIVIMNPNHIVLGGGISKRFDEFSGYLTKKVPIYRAHFKNRAGIIGAAMYAIENKYGVK